MACVSSSLVVPPASTLKLSNSCLQSAAPPKLSSVPSRANRLQLNTSTRLIKVQASYSDRGRTSTASIFVGGFVLGGLVVGALGCIYAPQISEALANTEKNKKELMKKLPPFIYDEEKALEKTRKKLAAKIEELNHAIGEASLQIRAQDNVKFIPKESK